MFPLKGRQSPDVNKEKSIGMKSVMYTTIHTFNLGFSNNGSFVYIQWLSPFKLTVIRQNTDHCADPIAKMSRFNNDFNVTIPATNRRGSENKNAAGNICRRASRKIYKEQNDRLNLNDTIDRIDRIDTIDRRDSKWMTDNVTCTIDRLYKKYVSNDTIDRINRIDNKWSIESIDTIDRRDSKWITDK